MFAPILQAFATRRCESCGGAVPDRMSRQRNDKGQLCCSSCVGSPQPFTASQGETMTYTQYLAHDGGDNAILHHCPICGSGALVGTSDGTVNCEFCQTAFTVQIQPSHSFMPQTVNGEPVNMPGMPQGEETEVGTPDNPVAEAEEAAQEAQEQAQDEPAGSDGGGQPPWLKGSALRTASGQALDVDAYMAHLALSEANDRDLVLDAVRHDMGLRGQR